MSRYTDEEFRKKKGTKLCLEALTTLVKRSCVGQGKQHIDEKEVLRDLAGEGYTWDSPWVVPDYRNDQGRYEVKGGQWVYAECRDYKIAEYIAATCPVVIRRYLNEFEESEEGRLKAEARAAELERTLEGSNTDMATVRERELEELVRGTKEWAHAHLLTVVQPKTADELANVSLREILQSVEQRIIRLVGRIEELERQRAQDAEAVKLVKQLKQLSSEGI